jgi:hypothetical protein
MIYEHGEPWWNDINKGKLLIRAPELSGNPTRNYLGAKYKELAKEITNLACEIFLSYFKVPLVCRKISRHRTDGFTCHPKKVVLWIFIALKNPSTSAGF